MESEQLLKKFEEEFEKMREELGFSSTLEELEEVFFLRDYVFEKGYVSPRLSRMLAYRISDLLGKWAGYLHQLLQPAPNDSFTLSEGGLLNGNERQRLFSVLAEFSALRNRNQVIALTRDSEAEGKWFDDAKEAWKKLLPHLVRISEQNVKHWELMVTDEESLKKSTRFETLREEYGISATLDELDKMCAMRDLLRGNNLTGESLLKAVVNRVSELLNSWNGWMHKFLVPNPHNMVQVTESKMLSEEERKGIGAAIDTVVELLSRKTLNGLQEDPAAHAAWIDDVVAFWKDEFKVSTEEYMKKINQAWAKRLTGPVEQASTKRPSYS